MLLMFIINSLVGSWGIKVLKAYRQQAVLKLKRGSEIIFLGIQRNDLLRLFTLTLILRSTVGLVMFCEACRDKKSQTTTSKWRMNGKGSS